MMDQKLGEVRVTKTGVLETRAKAQHDHLIMNCKQNQKKGKEDLQINPSCEI